MKWLWGVCLLCSNKHMHVLDKSHVKTYANNWIQNWKDDPTPLSDLRINEAWKSIIWCTENRHKDYSHCLVYKHTNFLILVQEIMIDQRLCVVGLIESPENIYTSQQTAKIHEDLLDIANKNNYTLDYSPLRKWSHGYHFYEYQDSE